MSRVAENQPMQQLEEWDDFVATRYRQGKSEQEFRNYKADANPGVFPFKGPLCVPFANNWKCFSSLLTISASRVG